MRYLGRGEDLTPRRLQEMEVSLSGQRAQLASSRLEEGKGAEHQGSELPVTRFKMPRLLGGHVERVRLLELMQISLERICTLVTAPAGFGKTTLLVAAGEQQRLRGWSVVWLALETEEHDPARFWRFVLTALEREVPGLAHDALALLRDTPLLAVEEMLTSLINTLAEQDLPLLLMLDDYQLVARPEINTGLSFLVEHMPGTMRLVLSSRSEPDLPLARWRVRGKLSELRQEHLRFSRTEAATFLTSTMGLHLEARQIAALEERKEGWIAGLQLAALSLAGQSDIDVFLANFMGDNHYISEYLFGEVILEQTPEVQEFLLRTSILPRLCGELCDAVTGGHEGQALLERFEAANLFLVSLDQQRRWYRYHPLFAEMLRERLKRQYPNWLAASHTQAAWWFGERGEIQDAIEHALAAPVYPLAVTLIGSQIEACLQRGEVATVLTWLQRLPSSALEISASTSLLAVLVWLMNGETTRATEVLHLLERTYPEEKRDEVLSGQWALVRSFRELLIGGDITLVLEQVEQALALLPTEQELLRDLASMVHAAFMALYQEDVRLALPAITQVVQVGLRHGNYLIASFALENRAVKEISQGRLRQAERTCLEARRYSLARQGEDSLFARRVYLRLGDLYREWNQLERARKALERGMSQVFILRYPEIVVDGFIALVRVYELLGEHTRAQETLEELERLTRDGRLICPTPRNRLRRFTPGSGMERASRRRLTIGARATRLA